MERLMDDTTDERIAEAVQKGEVNAFGTLIERYENRMSRYARKFLFDHDEVKDLVQDVFIKVYMNIQSFDVKKRFSPWIYRIAHNVFVNGLRKNTRWISIPLDVDTFFPHLIAKERAESETERKELKEALDRSLGKVSPKYRETLVLYFFEEMNYKEIAEILEIPISTVGVRLARGKAALKKLMHDYER